MLLTIATAVFSIIILTLLAASATKVFSNYFHPREDDWDDEDEYIYKQDQPLQHPTDYTDYRWCSNK